MGMFPDDETDTVSEGFEALKDPPFTPLDVGRLDSDSALPHKFKPYAMYQSSESQDFYFLQNLVKICPNKFHLY